MDENNLAPGEEQKTKAEAKKKMELLIRLIKESTEEKYKFYLERNGLRKELKQLRLDLEKIAEDYAPALKKMEDLLYGIDLSSVHQELLPNVSELDKIHRSLTESYNLLLTLIPTSLAAF